MQTYLNVVQIILGIALIALVLIELRGGGLGGVFGGSQTTISRQRRGPELLLFRLTIGAAILFFMIAIINVLVIG